MLLEQLLTISSNLIIMTTVDYRGRCLLLLRLTLSAYGLNHLLGTLLVKLPILLFCHWLKLIKLLFLELLDESPITTYFGLRFETEGFKDARMRVFQCNRPRCLSKSFKTLGSFLSTHVWLL